MSGPDASMETAAPLAGDPFAASPAAPSASVPFDFEPHSIAQLRAWCDEAGLAIPAVSDRRHLIAVLQSRGFSPTVTKPADARNLTPNSPAFSPAYDGTGS